MMFKPPKIFHAQPTDSEATVAPPTAPVKEFAPAPAPEAAEPATDRVWSPTTEPESTVEPNQVSAEDMNIPSETVASEPPPQQINDDSRYARPVSEPREETPAFTEQVAEPDVSTPAETSSINDRMSSVGSDSADSLIRETPEDKIKRLLGPNQKVVRVKSLNTIPFSDIWYTAEGIAYIRDKSTRFALVPFEAEDLEDFYKALEQGYTGNSSYAIRFAGEQYRVERIITLGGPQYNCRKMPGEIPDIFSLGLPKHIVDYLLTLPHESGLILFGGPTGMGKTTSASALMKKFLEMEGGFMYTIEDPPEMPLDGLYHAANGGLGLCKQCPVDNERWGDGIKSALRSRPRYILVGEIRTAETASQVLRAATSGHLVLSTIHASTVEDALESLIKYASGAGLTESLAADLLARGILAVIHQKLEGAEVLHPVLTAAFANPQLTGGDQMRSLIRNQTINLQTLVESQASRLFQGRPLFGNDKSDNN